MLYVKHDRIKTSLIILVFLFIFLLPYILVFFHLLKLQLDLNNSIVNGGYRGWHRVWLDENVSIKLPDQWKLETGQNLYIYDEKGSQIAFGKRYSGGQTVEDEIAFMEERFGAPVITRNQTHWQSTPTNLNFVSVETYSFETGGLQEFVRVTISDVDRYDSYAESGQTYVLFFYSNSQFIWYEEAVAIAYSMKTG
ncbi:MAG: hypothetical protein E7464_05900 [Ruminococcaceae bacterium]|nr:hypothetical protein [Oscillospiraceae bacterium]